MPYRPGPTMTPDEERVWTALARVGQLYAPRVPKHAEELRALVEALPAWNATRFARVLGVTRQRIYQIASENGIKIKGRR